MSFVLPVLVPVLGGLAIGVGALLAVLWLAPRGGPFGAERGAEILSEPRQFRFRHGYLMDHSRNVSFLLPSPINNLKAWDELQEALADVNEEIGPAFAALRDAGRPFKLTGMFGRDRILVLGLRDREDVRITVTTAEERQGSVRIDLPSLQAMEGEIGMLTRAGDTNPSAGWAVDDDGRVVWGNAAYLDLVARCAGPDAAHGWPLHALFPDGAGAQPGTHRRKIRDRDGTEHWFEITTAPRSPEGLRHMHGLSLDAVIRAEESLRTFIQTLTKSFAFLPTGLAIFDRQGQLALFNPALMDMTGLDGAWLSRRPQLTDFFDALRDRRKLPEPRDYKAWRDGLADRGRDASGQVYVETWTLPTGQTYRVTGRPQGDGAITLMLEDISAEVSASRSHRDEREMMREVIDRMDEGVLVFDAEGDRVLANEAVRTLWMPEAGGEDLPATLDGCLAFWKTLAGPAAIWDELRDFVRGPDADRAEWTETVRRIDGDALHMRVGPLPGRHVALTFTPADARDVAPIPLSRSRAGLRI